MSSDTIKKLKALIEESEFIKTEAINRDDPRFFLWHGEVREAVIQNAPVKKFAFDEISFASDFFLSKPIAERDNINDRIALVSDFQLAVRLLESVIQIAEKEFSRKEREFLRCYPNRIRGETSTKDENRDLSWTVLFNRISASNFSNREKEEIREALGSLQGSLKGTERDWERFKRALKFLLDFDREFALKAIPFLIKTFNCSNMERRPADLFMDEPDEALLGENTAGLQGFVGSTLQEIEKQFILLTLKETNNNKTRCAETLGISIRTLRNKLAEYKQENSN